MRIAAWPLALLFAATAARADPCDHATTQTELNVCAAENYRTADEALNETWTGLGRAAQARLRTGQRGWLADRETKCRSLAAEAKGGTIYPLLYFGCLTDWTRERVRWLKAHAP